MMNCFLFINLFSPPSVFGSFDGTLSFWVVPTLPRLVSLSEFPVISIRYVPRRVRANNVRVRLLVVDFPHHDDPVLVVVRQPCLNELTEKLPVVGRVLCAVRKTVVPPVSVCGHGGNQDVGDGVNVCGYGLSDADLVVHACWFTFWPLLLLEVDESILFLFLFLFPFLLHLCTFAYKSIRRMEESR